MKKIIKNILKQLRPLLVTPMASCLKRALPNYFDQALTVFVYHDVTDSPSKFSSDYNLWVSPELFRKQLAFIKSNFTVISPNDLIGKKIPQKAALITFDDGFKSFFKSAVPIINDHQVPVLLFLNMGPVVGEIFWAGLITYLCQEDSEFKSYLEDQVTESVDIPKPNFLKCSESIVQTYLKGKEDRVIPEVKLYIPEFASEAEVAAGSLNFFVSYGNHLYNHYIPALMTDDAFIDCYIKNKKVIEKYSNYVNMFSFPFGQPDTCFNDVQIRLLEEQGVDRIFCSSLGVNHDTGKKLLDRIDLTTQENSSGKIWFRLYLHKLLNHPIINKIL